MSVEVERHVMQAWQKDAVWLALLKPFSKLFYAGIGFRRLYYRLFKPKPFRVPVWVVGNITMGGTGKTPLVIALIQSLRAQGITAGVVSRGYKGHLNQKPTLVEDHHTPHEVGDEPLLIYRKTQCPVVIAKKRAQAVEYLLEKHSNIDVVLSDDGLQHYGLHRDKEIVMLDVMGLKNRKLFPEGPLREPLARLKQVDYILTRRGRWSGGYEVDYVWDHAYCLGDPNEKRALKDFKAQSIHAVAGIAHPDRFFEVLEGYDLDFQRHPFPDHHTFEPHDLAFEDPGIILMTEKDAVKCHTLVCAHKIWVVPMSAHLNPLFLNKLLKVYHG